MRATKYVLPVVVGSIAAMLLIMLGEHYMGTLYPLPPGTNLHDKEALGRAISGMPTGAFLFLLANFAIASFVAGVVATLMSKRETARPALVVGVVLTLSGVVNTLSVPHPVWFTAVSLFAYLPFTYLGYLVLKRK